MMSAKDRYKAKLCAHLGDVSRYDTCKTCRGTKKVKVYTCAIYEEAQIGTKVKGVQSCKRCPDFTKRK